MWVRIPPRALPQNDRGPATSRPPTLARSSCGYAARAGAGSFIGGVAAERDAAGSDQGEEHADLAGDLDVDPEAGDVGARRAQDPKQDQHDGDSAGDRDDLPGGCREVGAEPIAFATVRAMTTSTTRKSRMSMNENASQALAFPLTEKEPAPGALPSPSRRTTAGT